MDNCKCSICQSWRDAFRKRTECYSRLRGGIRPGVAFGAMPWYGAADKVVPFSQDEVLRNAGSILFGVVYDNPPHAEDNWRTEPVFSLVELSRGAPPVLGGEVGTVYRRCWAQPVPRHNSEPRSFRKRYKLANALDLSLSAYTLGQRIPAPLSFLPQVFLGFRADVAVDVEDTPELHRAVMRAIGDGSAVGGRPLAGTCAPCDGVVGAVVACPGASYKVLLVLKSNDGDVAVSAPTSAVWLVHEGETIKQGQQLFLFMEPRRIGPRNWNDAEQELGLASEWLADEVFGAARFEYEGYQCWPAAYVVEQAPNATRAWVDMRPLLPSLRDSGLIVCPPIDRQSDASEALCFASGDGGLLFDFLNSPQRRENLERQRAAAKSE